MAKGYISHLRLVNEGEDWRENISFDSHPEKAIYWSSPEDADIKCQELNRGVRIPSARGGFYYLDDFHVEETEPGRFTIYCEGPFIQRAEFGDQTGLVLRG
jgi:hypothetical protein